MSRIGCTAVNLKNTSDYYARYTISVICNGIVQNSRTACGLTDAQSRPLCATTCVSRACQGLPVVPWRESPLIKFTGFLCDHRRRNRSQQQDMFHEPFNIHATNSGRLCRLLTACRLPNRYMYHWCHERTRQLRF